MSSVGIVGLLCDYSKLILDVDLASKLKSVDFILEKIPLLEAKVAKLDAFVMSLGNVCGNRCFF